MFLFTLVNFICWAAKYDTVNLYQMALGSSFVEQCWQKGAACDGYGTRIQYGTV
jgi:hypothetical protein